MVSTSNKEQHSNNMKEKKYSSSSANYQNISSQPLDFLQRVPGLNGPTNLPIPVPSNKAEYDKTLLQWLWDYHCWLSFNAGSLYNLINQGQPENNISPSINQNYNNVVSNQLSMPHGDSNQQPLVMESRRGEEYKIPPKWKRIVVAFLDFLWRLCVIFVSAAIIDSFINPTEFIDCDFISINFTMERSRDFEGFTMAIVVTLHQFLCCLCESISLSCGLFFDSVTTPGKAFLNLRCISCKVVKTLPGSNRVLIFPATEVGFFQALLRSSIKHFSGIFYIPISLSMFFFSHNRTAYDMISNTIIVEM